MDFETVTFDVCRCYVRDSRRLLGDDIYHQILGWIRNRDIRSLASCVSRLPLAYASESLYRCLRQVEAFFKKNAIYSVPVECTKAAQISFERAERICRITNRRLDYYCANRHRLDADIDLWLSKAEGYIYRLLGNYDDFFGRLPELVRLTSGATSVDSRRNSSPHKKVSLRMSCTDRALPYVTALSHFYGYRPFRGRKVSSNRVEFVPKSWKTDRTIACEPTGNLPLQLAFDTYAKSRLRRFGINLSDQGRNQELARQGSIDGSFATLDLAMASDTLSFNTVAALLPAKWLKYLSDVRSPFGRLGSSYIKYAKFSSMGNGATFSLETLVFASACFAVGSKDFSVYGDDIIIETELFDDLVRFLRFLGFIPNVDKSFSSGPFRESCGLDSYNGSDVTPFYLRDWSGLKAQICHNVNGLVKVGLPFGELWAYCLDLSRRMHLPFVPENEDSMSGVMLYVRHAYSKKLIKVDGQIPYFRAYKPRNRSIITDDSRSLFLWYLDKYRSRDFVSEEPIIRSRTPAFDHKYVRKWSLWIPPKVGAFDHLYLWSEFIDPPN